MTAGLNGVYTRFHSISFPSEWGEVEKLYLFHLEVDSFHSISFPSEWGDGAPVPDFIPEGEGFHSISFPSEWGVESSS